MVSSRLLWVTDANGNCVHTEEFNGDMGVGQTAGDVAVVKLIECHTLDDFKKVALHFINLFGYDDFTDDEIAGGEYLCHGNIVSEEFHNVRESDGVGRYYRNWSSDYLYIANTCGSDIIVKDYDGHDAVVRNGFLNIFFFGKKQDEIGMRKQSETAQCEPRKKSMKDADVRLAESYAPVPATIEEVSKEYSIELVNDVYTMALIHSLEDIFDSGVQKVRIKISERTGRAVVDEDCYKSIGCQCVKVKKISDKGQFESKSDARLHIETSLWHFPCPDYKYSSIKSNLEKAICALTGIREVEVSSFSTGIVEHDEGDGIRKE